MVKNTDRNENIKHDFFEIYAFLTSNMHILHTLKTQLIEIDKIDFFFVIKTNLKMHFACFKFFIPDKIGYSSSGMNMSRNTQTRTRNSG